MDVAEGGDGMHRNRQQSCSVAQAPHAVLTLTVMMMLLLHVTHAVLTANSMHRLIATVTADGA
jgi:hypothetical protein